MQGVISSIMCIHQLPLDCECILFTYLTKILADSSMTGLAWFLAVVGVIACLTMGTCAQSKWNIMCMYQGRQNMKQSN